MIVVSQQRHACWHINLISYAWTHCCSTHLSLIVNLLKIFWDLIFGTHMTVLFKKYPKSPNGTLSLTYLWSQVNSTSFLHMCIFTDCWSLDKMSSSWCTPQTISWYWAWIPRIETIASNRILKYIRKIKKVMKCNSTFLKATGNVKISTFHIVHKVTFQSD